MAGYPSHTAQGFGVTPTAWARCCLLPLTKQKNHTRCRWEQRCSCCHHGHMTWLAPTKVSLTVTSLLLWSPAPASDSRVGASDWWILTNNYVFLTAYKGLLERQDLAFQLSGKWTLPPMETPNKKNCPWKQKAQRIDSQKEWCPLMMWTKPALALVSRWFKTNPNQTELTIATRVAKRYFIPYFLTFKSAQYCKRHLKCSCLKFISLGFQIHPNIFLK